MYGIEGFLLVNHLSPGQFHGGNDSTLWVDKEKHLISPIDKSQTKGFNGINIRVNDILEKQRIDVFIGTLKDNIQHEVHLWEPDSLEKAYRLARKVESKIMLENYILQSNGTHRILRKYKHRKCIKLERHIYMWFTQFGLHPPRMASPSFLLSSKMKRHNL